MRQKGLKCRHGCQGNVVVRVSVPGGCVCFPKDRKQYLCAQHLVKLSDGNLKGFKVIEDYRKEVQDEEFGQALAKVAPRLRRYASVLCFRDPERVKDLLQETLLKCWEKRELFRYGGLEELSAWAGTIMHNCYVNSARRFIAHGWRDVELMEETLLLASPDNPEAVAYAHEIFDALVLLDDRQRVLVMACAEGASYNEMADHFGVVHGTVRSRLSRGRDALRTIIGEPSTYRRHIKREMAHV